MASGFITNSEAVTGIGTTFAKADLVTLDTMDGDSQSAGVTFIPGGAQLSHIVVNGENRSSVAKLFVAGWTDSDGDVIFLGPSESPGKSIAVGLTSAGGEFGCVIPTDPLVPKFSPDTYAARTLYIGLYGDAGSFDIPAGGIELHWFTPDTAW